MICRLIIDDDISKSRNLFYIHTQTSTTPMMAYESAENWAKAMARLFNPDPEDHGRIMTPADKAADARVRAASSVLYIPDVSLIDIDGSNGDFQSLVDMVYSVRRTTVVTGALVVIEVVDFVRDTPADGAAPEVRWVWHITLRDHPPGSGLPPARRPLPATVVVHAQATLDKPGPDGRAVVLHARSKAITPLDSSDDDD